MRCGAAGVARPWLCYTHTHTPLVFLYSSNWEEAGCTLLRTEILAEWVDCRGVSTVPCLRAQVNLTASNQTAFLHFDEEPVLHALEVRISGASSQRRHGSPPEEREEKKSWTYFGVELPKLLLAF